MAAAAAGVIPHRFPLPLWEGASGRAPAGGVKVQGSPPPLTSPRKGRGATASWLDLFAAARDLCRMPTPAELRASRADLERLIEQRQTELGPDDPALADDLRQLGRIVHDLGDFADATALLERARALHIQEHGPEHPEVATDLNHLGLVLHDAGDLEVAYSVFERALSIDERTQGPQHPSVGRDANNLAGVLRDLGDSISARAALEYALGIYTAALGAEHPTTRAVAGNLAALG